MESHHTISLANRHALISPMSRVAAATYVGAHMCGGNILDANMMFAEDVVRFDGKLSKKIIAILASCMCLRIARARRLSKVMHKACM